MLVLTRRATEVVDKIGSRSSEPLGVRISRGGRSTNPLGVSIARRPHEGDEVIKSGKGRVYVGRYAVDALRGRTLDARKDERGRVEFTVSPRA